MKDAESSARDQVLALPAPALLLTAPKESQRVARSGERISPSIASCREAELSLQTLSLHFSKQGLSLLFSTMKIS